eukprot:m.122704 g.122704  ORF g.122704 m.122704 type:complete len:382 (+) comp11118_c0_seq2:36-1181(+)
MSDKEGAPAADGGRIGPFSFRGGGKRAAPPAASTSAAGPASASTHLFDSFLQQRQSEGHASAAPSLAAAASTPATGATASSSSNNTTASPHAAAPSSAASGTSSVVSAPASRGLLAPFVPTARDSHNYVPPAPTPTVMATQGSPARTDAGAAASGASQTPPSQPLPAGAAGAAGNRVLINPRQKGNRVLEHIRNVPYEFSEDIIPDFLVGQRHCVTFLSLRYHKLHPEYVHGRLREMGRGYTVRVLLVLIDMKDSDDALRELSRVAIGKGLSLIVCSSEKEAGRYIETFKLYENKPADMLQGAKAEDYLSQLRSALTTVKSVNKTDTVTLLTTFGSLKDMMQASADDLRMCPGFGEQKAQRLQAVFDQPFNTRGTQRKSGT